MGTVRGRVFPDVTFGAEIEGIGWVESAWTEQGIATCWWGRAPEGLATRRQMRAAGACPGGHGPVAAMRRRPGGRLLAYLYRIDLARRKRTATPAVLAALDAAMRARRTCRTCGHDTGCCVPRSLGQCWPCHLATADRATYAHRLRQSWAHDTATGTGTETGTELGRTA